LLLASEKNLRNSLDGSPLGIYIIDSELNTLYANRALLDIFGYKDFDELRIRPLDEYYTPESRVGLAQRRDRYLRGEPNPSTFEVDTHEQSSWYFKTQASPDLKLRLI
jgi:PAS domain S-box-containing protein